MTFGVKQNVIIPTTELLIEYIAMTFDRNSLLSILNSKSMNPADIKTTSKTCTEMKNHSVALNATLNLRILLF